MPPHELAQFDAFAVAAPGISALLAAELASLGITIESVESAGVGFRATRENLLTVNLWSRLASRVLVRIAEFAARDFATLEKQAARVPWATYIAPHTTVRFRVTCRKSRLYHSDAVAERVARGVIGVVPTARGALRTRDDDDAEGDASDHATTQLFVVRLEHDRCTISADTSGDLLHRRGWRQAIAKAPLRETLAATMLAACEWRGELPLVDPFCGSGTIGIEGALRARNVAPGLHRSFALERWPGVSPAWVTKQRAAARAVALPSLSVPIVMSDRDAGACDAARANAERAGVLADVQIIQRALSDVDLAALGTRGLVLTNPPYGLRVSEGADLRGLFARLGDVVRAGGAEWRAALLVPDRRLIASMRLSFEPIVRTSNGGIAVAIEYSKEKRSASVRRADSKTP